MRLDHFLAMFPQVCLDVSAVLHPVELLVDLHAVLRRRRFAQAARIRSWEYVLLQMVMFTFLFPLTQAATLLPLGTEAVLRFLGWPAAAPIYLVLSLVECAVIVILYHFTLHWQGVLFQAREQQILESVTNRCA